MAGITYELELPPGIFSDDTTFGAKGRWADGSNVRFQGGRPETLGHISRILDGGVAANPRTIFAFSSGSSPVLIVGGDAALYTSNIGGISTIENDITPVGLGSGISYWAFDSWGDSLMAAPKGGSLYTSNGGAGVAATIVSQAPAAMNHMLVTAQRQILALGCNEEISTTFNPMCIRGCDLEDYTNWTTSAANNAFEHILEGQGKIVAGRRVGDYIAVWTNGMLFLGSFIGDPGQTYRFEPVSDGCGLVGPGAVAELGGVVYWMSSNHRFFRWSPGEPPQQIPCPISRDLQDNILASATRLDVRTTAVKNSAFNEVWWFYPDKRDSATGGYRYVALNTVDGTWFRGQLDRRAAYHADFLYNPGSGSSYRSWRPFVSVDGDGKVYCHELENPAQGEVGFSSFIQSADQYIESGRRRVQLQGVNPDFEQQGCPVDLTLYMRDRPQSATVTRGPYSIDTAADKKDFRASGMIMSVKISLTTNIGTNVIESWRLGKPVFRGIPMGER